MIALVVLSWAGPALEARLPGSPDRALWAMQGFDIQQYLARPLVFLLGALGLSTLALTSAAPRRSANGYAKTLRAAVFAAAVFVRLLCEVPPRAAPSLCG